MAYYPKINTEIKRRLYVDLIRKNHPKFKGALGKHFKEHTELFNIEAIVENMMAICSEGKYKFIDGVGEDFSDGSECKTSTLYSSNKYIVEVKSIRSKYGNLKKGGIRCIILNPKLEKLHFVFVPKAAVKRLMTTKNGTPKKNLSMWLTYTNSNDSFSRCFEKYGIIEYSTFKELALEVNH